MLFNNTVGNGLDPECPRPACLPVGGREGATRLHVQRRIGQVQLKDLQAGIGAEGSVQLLCGGP